jgi:pyruvate dehydrogenase E2 component (dihydrolipoamide acetyltransferase)
MPIPIEMPKLSDTMTEGTLVRWRKQHGDKIEIGDVIAEVETDKATMEMEAFDEGILHIVASEGSTVPIGEKIGVLLEEGEQLPAEREIAPRPADVSAPEPTRQPAVKPAGITTPQPDSGTRVKASPLARKVAAEHGIDLGAVRGTGPGGRIVKSDVLAARGAGTVSPKVAAAAEQRTPLSGMRRTIAQRLLESKTTIPHFYLHIEVDAAALTKIRSQINAALAEKNEPKLTVNDFVLKAAVAAAVRAPKVNAAFAGDAIVQYGSVHLAFAVAVEDGLVTPVIRNAETKSLREISRLAKDLATRAREKKLKPEEYQGGTITVSNLGSYGIESFSAIINPPQAAIVSVGAIVKKPVVNERDEIVVGERMSVGLSCDHRVVDGAIGSQYLSELRQLLENPALMLI